MDKFHQPAAWRKYGAVVIVVAVFLLVILLTNIYNLYEFVNNTGIAGRTSAQSAQETGAPAPPSAVREYLTRDTVISLTNKSRADYGLLPLTENQLLNRIADERARDMLEKQYFAHVSPTGEQASDIAQRVGYAYKIIAENIGSGDFYTNQKIVDGWMQSPGHRANILSSEVHEIGVAVVPGKIKGTDAFIAVQIFGLSSLPVDPPKVCVAPSENLRRDIAVKKAELESLKGQINRLKNELDAEETSIENDRKHVNIDPQKILQFNERINVFNEKSRWYNGLVGEARAKASVAESMINEYNRVLQAYNECNASD